RPAAQGPRAGGGVTSRALSTCNRRNPAPRASSACRCFGLRGRRLMVERLAHARRHALLAQRFFVFLAQKGILQPIRNGSTALGHVDGALVGIFLARHPRLVFAMVVGTVPADQTQRLFAGAEMRVEPVAAIGRGGDEADRLVILAINLIALALLPRPHPRRP